MCEQVMGLEEWGDRATQMTLMGGYSWTLTRHRICVVAGYAMQKILFPVLRSGYTSSTDQR